MIILKNGVFFKLLGLATLDAEVGVFEEFGGEFFHEETETHENSVGGSDKDGSDKKFTWV